MKVVLITGSTSGIGLGIANEFAKEGYDIALNGLEENGDEIAADLAARHLVKCRFFAGNLQFPEQVESLVKSVELSFGKIDVLVNNAGIQFVSPIEDFPTAKWDAIIAINLNSVFHASKAVWLGMKQRGFGRIINIASAHGLVASEYKGAYVAAKHGVVGFTKVLGLEGANLGITANAICPGYVRTPLVEKQISEQALAHGISEDEVISKIMLEKHAIKDFVSIESIGRLALHLASEYGDLITGTAIPVDGGWLAK